MNQKNAVVIASLRAALRMLLLVVALIRTAIEDLGGKSDG